MKGPVLAATLAVFAGCLSNTLYMPLAAFLVERRQVGWLLSVQGLASFFALLHVGHAVDHFGAKPVLQQGIVGLGGGLVCSSFSSGFLVQLAGRALCGAGSSILFNAGMALVMSRYTGHARAQHVGTALGIGTLGTLVGPPLAGYTYCLGATWGLGEPQVVPLAAVAVVLVAAAIVLHLLPDAGPDSEAKETLLGSVQSADGFCSRYLGVYAAVGGPSWAIAGILAMLFGALSALLCAGVLDMRQQGMSAATIGLAPVPAGLVQAVTSQAGGALSSSNRRKALLLTASPLALSACLIGMSLAICAGTFSVALSIVVVLCMATAATGIVDAPSITMMADLATMYKRGYGEAVTATELAVTAGQSVGPALGVLIVDLVGLPGLCLALAAGA
eukprot:CAMPEP_0176070978 /NCGR_PEP_ID=MMETSP0120_2-20121206/35449_1 /TAXON_ID=160619 /ORGANISM="Kryptoperidinium foliaceum, Strain CCMP 1326" /LENGTH=388 /DNA_ID=CAMNT_0017404631 /DNA_START=41 /DNA_END=1203 /DNA_ORIENTATION=+